MARFFSLNRRVFRLDINHWREMRRKGRYLRYYTSPLKDDRNTLARVIDFYGPLAAVLLVTWAAAWGYAGGLLKGAVLAAPAMALEVLAAFGIRKAFRDNAAVHERLWRAGRQCQERIKKAGSSRRLEKLVLEILSGLEGFTGVQIEGRGGRGPGRKNGVIAARALYRGAPLAVGYLPAGEGGGAFGAEKVSAFREEMKKIGINRGILVASGFFSAEAGRAALEGRRETRVALVDLYRLVELARATGHPVFPAAAGSPVTGGDRGDSRGRRMLRNALTREKARGYSYAAAVMLAMYCLARPGDFFGSGYLFFGAVNLALSVYCLVSNRESDLLGPSRAGG